MALARLSPTVSISLATAIVAAAAAVSPASAAVTTRQPLRELERHDPLVQVTEVVANTRNVNGVDAFEYVETVNASDAPQDWADLRLRCVHPLVGLTTVAHVIMPIEGDAPVVDPGDTFVLWIVNDDADHLTVADFNAEYGTHLEEGRTVVRVRVRGAGLANGSMRGVEVAAASGISVSRAYYNADGAHDAVAGRAVQYGPTSDADAPQPRLGLASPSPGYVDAAQAAGAPVADPGAGDAPTVLTDSRSTFVPGRAVILDAWARDVGVVRSVTLEVTTDLDPEPVIHELEVDEVGLYAFELSAAHTVGRSTISYRFSASDGHATVRTEPVTLMRAAEPPQVRLRAVDSWNVGTRADVESARVGALAVREPLSSSPVVTGNVQMVAASADGTQPSIAVDGRALATYPELEHEPIFGFDATLTDAYFRNGVTLDGEVLTVFDLGYYSERRTVQTMVPLERVDPGEAFTLRVHSGTKARTAVDPDEANDDFEISNLRLVLPDGTSLLPDEHPDRRRSIAVGDGAHASDWVEATFSVPDEHFSARAAIWDSTATADGEHEVLAAHPERTAFVNLHEYMLTTGGLGLTPPRIHDEVIATNPNVRLVLSGHYHDAFTRIDGFDDDGDGVDDRQVTSTLFDYQDLPNGGEGYLRLLHFDNESASITARTYSDHLRDYDAVHPSLAAEHQEFTIPYAQAGIQPAAAVLRTDALQVDLLGDEVLAAFSDVPAGTTVSAGSAGDVSTPSVAGGWYVRAVDPYGAVATSDVRAF